MNLQEWFSGQLDNDLYDNLIYAEGAKDQVVFLRDNIGTQLFKHGWDENQAQVLSTHRSKSCELPVVEFKRGGLRAIVRGNFFDWKVSVDSDRVIPDLFFDLFIEGGGKSINPVYLEGFRSEWAFGSFDNGNGKQFTIGLPYGKGPLWAFMFLLTRGYDGSY